MSAQFISDADLADEFLKTGPAGDDTAALVKRVEGFLVRTGLTHRDRFNVAREAIRLDAERRKPKTPVVDPGEAARLSDLREGFGDQQMPDVSSMSWDEYRRYREAAGIGRSANSYGIFGRA